jgi:amino acid adenylation domain-containing protein
MDRDHMGRAGDGAAAAMGMVRAAAIARMPGGARHSDSSLTAALPASDVAVTDCGALRPITAAAMNDVALAPPPEAGIWQEGPRRDLAWEHVVPALAEQAARTPERVALRQGDRSLTYAALDAEANRLANLLRGKGIGRGDLVALVLPRSIGTVAAILGVLKTGAAYLPIDPTYPAARIGFVIADSGARLTLSTAAHASLLPPRATHLLLDLEAESIAAQPSHAPPLAGTPDDRIYVIYTSGSTGQPKGAAVGHRSFANLLQWYLGTLALNQADATLLVSALGFDLTQKNLFAPLLVSATLHLPEVEAYDPAAMAKAIEQGGITWINCTPSTFLPVAEGPAAERPACLASLRWVVLGGEPIPAARLRPWLLQPSCRARILNTYGPTECTDICAAWAFGPEAVDPVPLGLPIDNVALAILDENGASLPAGAEGELWIGGAGVGQGYLGRPDLQASRFLPRLAGSPGARMYRTGDRVRRRADGTLEFLGRVDHQVKLRGHRVELGEIEAALASHPALREAAVALQPDAAGGAALVAHCVTRPGAAWPGKAALRRHAGAMLPAHMVPAGFVRLQALPLSPNGKLDRRALGQASLGRVAPATDDLAGTASKLPEPGGILAVLQEIWRSALGRPPDDMQSNFFDLGGTSLSLAEVQTAIRRRLGLDVPMVELFAHPTLAALARHLTPGAPAAATTTPAARARSQAEALHRLAIARKGAAG